MSKSATDSMANLTIPDPGRTGIIRLADADLVSDIQKYILDLKTSGRGAPVHPTNEINDFFPLVQNAILSRQNEEGVPEDKRLLFLEDDPPEEIDTSAITFELQARVPGKMDQGAAGTGRIKEVVSHYRGEIDHPDHPGEKLVTMGRFYDNWIRFYIQTRTNKEARKILLWFERLMSSFSWYFRYNGFRVIEEGVGDRERVDKDGLVLTRYPITYFVRSEDVYFVSAQKLKEIIISPNISITD